MSTQTPRSLVRGATLLGSLTALMIVAGGCSLVKRQELEDRLSGLRAELRQEMTQGDEATAAQLNTRIDSVANGFYSRLSALEDAIGRLERDYGARIERLETALLFDMPVYFAFDDATLRPQDLPVLDRFAEVIREYYPRSTVTVEGFTDPVGTVEYNLMLGQKRADAVRTYLIESGGLPAGQVRAVSYGENADRLIAKNEHGPGEAGWQNRRVALVVDFGGE